MKNILFTTVRQGNCGDEFIFMGVLNIIDHLQPAYNKVILNKNVEVCRRLLHRNKAVKINVNNKKMLEFDLEKISLMDWPSLYDNSFADYQSLDFIDAVIFAGTPEWMGYKLNPLYEKLNDYGGPIFFLGLGYHEGLSRCGDYSVFEEKNIHRRAKAFVVRDSLLIDYLKPVINATLLPCPALLCSRQHKIKGSLNRIGFTMQAKEGDAMSDFVPEKTYNYSVKLLDEISKLYKVEVVCHWIEDLVALQRNMGDKYALRYSYNASDYMDIYDTYDLVISTRIHGSAMAASLGIPTYTISHSLRTDTVRGFLSRVILPDEDIRNIIDEIRSLDLAEASRKIIAHKVATIKNYQELLSPFFPL